MVNSKNYAIYNWEILLLFSHQSQVNQPRVERLKSDHDQICCEIFLEWAHDRARVLACAWPLWLGGSSFRSCFRRMGFIRLLMGLAVKEGRNERALLLASMGRDARKGTFNIGGAGNWRWKGRQEGIAKIMNEICLIWRWFPCVNPWGALSFVFSTVST